MDTCHSGTGLKAIDFLLDRRPRLLLPPSIATFEEVKERSDQTIADARIGQTCHEAFTYYLCQNINKSENKLTRKKLLAKVRANLKKNKYHQLPQLETNATARNKQW